MSHKVVVAPIETSRSASRTLRRALMEAGVVLSLTLAIIAVICTLGIERAGASELGNLATIDASGRLTIGAVILSIFAGLCVLTTFMLRQTLAPTPRSQTARHRNRMG